MGFIMDLRKFSEIDFHARNQLVDLLEYLVKNDSQDVREELTNWLQNSMEAHETSAAHIKEAIAALKNVEIMSIDQIKREYDKLKEVKMTPI